MRLKQKVLHYECGKDELRIHKCGGIVIMKKRGLKSQPFCTRCGKYLNIWSALVESRVKKIEEVSPCSS